MYSRHKFPSDFSAMGRREVGYRQPVYVPHNYSGTALGAPPDGVSPATDGTRLSSADLPEEDLSVVPADASRFVEPAEETAEATTVAAEPVSKGKSLVPPSLFSGFLSGHHFPFGHGIGYEELLILGLILFLMSEGREGDMDGKGNDDLSMTLLLLGALLFCG